jgi:hypothetical protein
MGPRRSWQEVVQEVERSATCTCPGSTADAQEAGDRVAAVARDPGKEELFPAEHPFIRLEPATFLDDTPHVCATDSTLLFKGNVSHMLLHAYAHPSTPRRQAQPNQPPPGFVHNRGDSYVPFITTYNGVQQPVNFVQTILTPTRWSLGYARTRISSLPSPFTPPRSTSSVSDPSTYWKTWRC